MITEEKKQILDQFLKELPIEQIIWSSGYLAGLVEQNNFTNTKSAIDKITVIYITDTGNSKKIATDLSTQLKNADIQVKLKSADQYRFDDLKKEQYLILIVSTHGEGEIPESGLGFYEYLSNKKPDLSNLKYALLALGDSNYPLFCEAGKIFDDKFKELLAQEFLPKTDFDLDFEELTPNWQKQILQALNNQNSKKAKKNYQGTIINNIILNDQNSSKEVHHIEIAANGLNYQPGDAIAIKIADNAPRLYSIASSLKSNDGEVHLSVAKVENGLCSSYLSSLKPDDKIEFYIAKNNQFRLPDDDKDIIMVGAGTGIAPFRAFLQEREANNSKGKNWLFFGDRNSHQDFLYQSEWQEYLSSGLLNQMDVAFSRDQENKIYVQDRILENAQKIKNWLENGAYFYVCGGKEMEKSVKKTLLEAIGQKAFTIIETNNRYLKDTY